MCVNFQALPLSLATSKERVASFPGSCEWVEKKEPGTHCLRMLMGGGGGGEGGGEGGGGGELSIRKQCVPGSFFSTHSQEPGNEATLSLLVAKERGKA